MPLGVWGALTLIKKGFVVPQAPPFTHISWPIQNSRLWSSRDRDLWFHYHLFVYSKATELIYRHPNITTTLLPLIPRAE